MKKWRTVIIAAVLAVCFCAGCSSFLKAEYDGSADIPGEGFFLQQAAGEETNQITVTAYTGNGESFYGIPVISGEYTLENCLELPDLASLKGIHEGKATDSKERHAADESGVETGDPDRDRAYAAWKQEIMDRSSLKACPEDMVRHARAEYEADHVGKDLSLEDYLKQTGMSRSEFMELENAYVIDQIKEKLVLEALCRVTGITRESEEYLRLLDTEGENPEDPDEVLFRVVLDRIYGG